MTETLEPVADEVDQPQLAEQLLARAKAQGVELLGPNGLLNQLTKNPIHVKIRDGQVTNRPIYVVVGVTVAGERDILGLWAGDGGEGYGTGTRSVRRIPAASCG